MDHTFGSQQWVSIHKIKPTISTANESWFTESVYIIHVVQTHAQTQLNKVEKRPTVWVSCAKFHSNRSSTQPLREITYAQAAINHCTPWLHASTLQPHLLTYFIDCTCSHMRVLPPGTLCPTTSAPRLILSNSENCTNHTILVNLITFVDFCVFIGVLAFGWLLQCTYGLGSHSNGCTINFWYDMMW